MTIINISKKYFQRFSFQRNVNRRLLKFHCYYCRIDRATHSQKVLCQIKGGFEITTTF